MQVTIFHSCEPEFLHDLVLKMRTFIYTPDDLVCRKGEVAREMYFSIFHLISYRMSARDLCVGVILERNAREMFIIADGLLEVIRSANSASYAVREGKCHRPMCGLQWC